MQAYVGLIVQLVLTNAMAPQGTVGSEDAA